MVYNKQRHTVILTGSSKTKTKNPNTMKSLEELYAAITAAENDTTRITQALAEMESDSGINTLSDRVKAIVKQQDEAMRAFERSAGSLFSQLCEALFSASHARNGSLQVADEGQISKEPDKWLFMPKGSAVHLGVREMTDGQFCDICRAIMVCLKEKMAARISVYGSRAEILSQLTREAGDIVQKVSAA